VTSLGEVLEDAVILDGIANGSAGATQAEVDADSLDGGLTLKKAGKAGCGQDRHGTVNTCCSGVG
jgi:hypothetical protein